MISFQVQAHHIRPNIPVVEVLMDGKVVATICPGDKDDINIVSAHFKGVGGKDDFRRYIILRDGVEQVLPIPSVSLTFEPGPYKIRDGRIVRLNKE